MAAPAETPPAAETPAQPPAIEPAPLPAPNTPVLPEAAQPTAPPAIVVPFPTAPPAPEPPKAEDKSKWQPTIYGFVEMDVIGDSTQSFNDLAGNAAIAHSGTYQADHDRLTFGARNSRLGLKLSAPDVGEVHPSALAEMDFLGNQPAGTAESAVFASPLLRMRHMWLKLENPYVDVQVGQTWQLFGAQPYFHPNTVEIQGVPGQIYSRSPQVRLTHRFKGDTVDFEIAGAASRPPSRDTMFPDAQLAARLFVNSWKGVHTAGSTSTAVDPAAIGVSGVLRGLRAPELQATPHQSDSVRGWGVSADLLLPIIPATPEDHSNALTLTGSYVRGEAIADLFTGLNGGLTSYPAVPNPMKVTPTPSYTPTIDSGLVMFDANGYLHAIGWQSFIVGAQYYLPPSGKLWLSANYSRMNSHDAAGLAVAPAKVFNKSQWADLNLFWDAVAQVRFGLEGAWFEQTYVDKTKAHNVRVQASGFYIF